MTSSIARITGMFGVACVLLSCAQFPLWVIGGAPPFYDSEALARHLYDIRTTAFIRILMDQGIEPIRDLSVGKQPAASSNSSQP